MTARCERVTSGRNLNLEVEQTFSKVSGLKSHPSFSRERHCVSFFKRQREKKKEPNVGWVWRWGGFGRNWEKGKYQNIL